MVTVDGNHVVGVSTGVSNIRPLLPYGFCEVQVWSFFYLQGEDGQRHPTMSSFADFDLHVVPTTHESSYLDRVGYIPSQQLLLLQFTQQGGDARMVYYDVPQEVYEKVLHHPSPGSFWKQERKNFGKFKARRIIKIPAR